MSRILGKSLLRASLAIVLGGLPAVPRAAAQSASATIDPAAAVREYVRLADGALAIEVALGQTTGSDADARLDAAARDFVSRGAPEAELFAMRSQLQIAATGYFADLDRSIAAATSFPGPLPLEVSRALARRLLGTASSKFAEALANGDNPLPMLAQASKVLARVRGWTDLPRELDRFADAAERAERITASMPPPPARPPGTIAAGAPAGPMGPGGPGAQPGMRSPPPQPGPVPGSAPAPGSGPVAMGPTPVAQPPSGLPRAAPPPGAGPGPGTPQPAAVVPRPAPAGVAAAPARQSLQAPPRRVAPGAGSDPMLAVLGVGTMEAEARLEGFTWIDLVGRTWPPAVDSQPDTEIELKLLAPGLILDWIEVRSAPDPTEAIWTTNGTTGTLPIGLVKGGLQLNDAEGSVSGLQIEDFVVFMLYIQDDGLLERLEQPGTITITYRGGDVATVPIESLW